MLIVKGAEQQQQRYDMQPRAKGGCELPEEGSHLTQLTCPVCPVRVPITSAVCRKQSRQVEHDQDHAVTVVDGVI
jgi:hypothetical protein